MGPISPPREIIRRKMHPGWVWRGRGWLYVPCTRSPLPRSDLLHTGKAQQDMWSASNPIQGQSTYYKSNPNQLTIISFSIVPHLQPPQELHSLDLPLSGALLKHQLVMPPRTSGNTSMRVHDDATTWTSEVRLVGCRHRTRHTLWTPTLLQQRTTGAAGDAL
jgi:hypothetical protein